MIRAIPIVRNLLWAQGACCCLGAPQVLYRLVVRSSAYQSTDPKFLTLQYAIYAGLGYLFFTGLVALLTAYGLEQNRSWAPLAMRIVSIMNLPVLPIGTIFGAYTLWLTWNHQARALLIEEFAGPGRAVPTHSTSNFWAWRTVQVVQIILTLILVPWTASYLSAHGSPTLSFWSFIGCFMFAVPFGILCHETGHVIAGKMSGFHFQTLAAGPFVVSKLSDGWRFQLGNSMGLWSGMTAMSPRRPYRLNSNAIFFVAGGPIGSFVCGAASLALLLAGPGLHLGVLAEFFGILGVIESINCVANLVPFAVPGGYTDGSRLLQLIQKRPEGMRFLAELAFGLSDTTTLRPRDWHPQWIESVTEDPRSPGFSRGCYHAYVYNLDCGRIDDASVWLARCMDSHNALRRDPYRWILAIENAFFEARHLKNLEAARQWLTVPRAGIPAERFTLLRVKAALHVAEGERELAAQAIETALHLHARSVETGRQQFERDVLREVQNWFDEMTGSASLARLADAVRERDSLIEAAKALAQRPSKIDSIRRFLKAQP